MQTEIYDLEAYFEKHKLKINSKKNIGNGILFKDKD